MSTEKLCAVSVDLDPLTAYYQIHGLGTAPAQVRATIMRKVLPRFESLFGELEIPATLFVVGRELQDDEAAQRTLLRMVQCGHELGNHTYSHPYELCRLDEMAISEEICRAHRTIVDVVGEQHAPQGFRSPGYFINAKVARVLLQQGYRYDSSMFPSPPYYLAKFAILSAMMLRGRKSAAVLSDPRGLMAPLDPYRLDTERPWQAGAGPLVELPVSVMPKSRIPAIGTLFAAGPRWLTQHVIGAMRERRFYNFELHGIDLADAVDDSIPTALAGRQPDLRIPFAEKCRIFKETLRQLKGEFHFVTLAQAAARYA